MSKRGVRLRIKYVKPGGKSATYWASAPGSWDQVRQKQRDAWVASAANKHCPGATGARVTGRD